MNVPDNRESRISMRNGSLPSVEFSKEFCRNAVENMLIDYYIDMTILSSH